MLEYMYEPRVVLYLKYEYFYMKSVLLDYSESK